DFHVTGVQTCALPISLRTLWSVFVALGSMLIASTSSAASAGDEPRDKIVISGASGQLGQLVVRDLLARGVPASDLILVSRTPERSEERRVGKDGRLGR